MLELDLVVLLPFTFHLLPFTFHPKTKFHLQQNKNLQLNTYNLKKTHSLYINHLPNSLKLTFFPYIRMPTR